MAHKTSNEPVLWALFAGGGGATALLYPIHILLFGILFPLGCIDSEPFGYERMYALVGNPIVKLYLFAIIMLPLFHAAHRIKFVLVDIGLKDLRLALTCICYGGAAVLTVIAAVSICSI